MKFCSNCGNQLPEGANVCPLCGTPVGGKQTNYQSAARPVVQNRNIATCIILSIVT